MGEKKVTAPLPGTILKIKVDVGQKVSPRDVILIIEAMKMENEIDASVSGEVKEVYVKERQTVKTGAPLVSISIS
jgi:biotin carboxyl carrier protein